MEEPKETTTTKRSLAKTARLVVLTLRMRKARWELASLREDEQRLRDDQDAVHNRLVRLNAAAKDLEQSATGPSPPREE